MSYILQGTADESIETFLERYETYYTYLESIKDSIPKSAYLFATASWHYNHEDPRCPHDSWVETVTVRELSSGERQQIRSTQIFIRLLGAFHNGYIELTYEHVHSYSINQLFTNPPYGHGDWLIDEVRLSQDGLVLHEIWFEQGKWLIECRDIVYQWKPFDVTTAAA